MAEIALMFPFLQITTSENPDHVVGGVGNCHYPFLGGLVPDYFGVAELGAVDVEDGVGGVGSEGVAAVEGICYVLVLDCSVEGVDCYYAVGLVGEEAGGVVWVEDC